MSQLIPHKLTGRIRARDGKCVILGVVSWEMNRRLSTQHIFPLGGENHWIQCEHGRYITDMDDTAGVSKIMILLPVSSFVLLIALTCRKMAARSLCLA